jgi:uncharacterized protein YndB with AHSA1/START domain
MDLERDELEQAVRRKIVLPVDRPTAWSRIADAAGLRSWLADEVDLDVRPGAQGTIRWHGGETRLVEVEEVEPTRRVCLIWRELDGEPTLVELTLQDVQQGTSLTVVEMPLRTLRAFASAAERQSSAPRGPQMLAAIA